MEKGYLGRLITCRSVVRFHPLQPTKERAMSYPRLKLFEATIRTPDGKEFKDRVGAQTAEEAKYLLQQRHGPRAVPYLPKMIAG